MLCDYKKKFRDGSILDIFISKNVCIFDEFAGQI